MPIFKALTDMAVAGEPVAEGGRFEADEEAMAEAVARGLVEPVKEKPGSARRRQTESA